MYHLCTCATLLLPVAAMTPATATAVRTASDCGLGDDQSEGGERA
jgi:hypothetical protein